jgi:alpha-D-xyloside xylohydrolase
VKFTDGYWQLREGVQARYPAQVYDVVAERDALTIYAPTHKIEHRGDTLNEPLLTVRCASPAPDVISVSVSHFIGARPRQPQFQLNTDPSVQVRTEVDDSQAAITSGALTARFGRGDRWKLEFLANGIVLTTSAEKAMALLTKSGEYYIREQLSLGIGEFAYGLGERFGPLVKNGQVVDIWNADAGTSSEQTYKNVLFYLTNQRVRSLGPTTRAWSPSRSAPRQSRGLSSVSPAKRWNIWSSTGLRRRRSSASTPG